MTERKMTDNEINLRFDGLQTNINTRLDNQDATLKRIEGTVRDTHEQATKTNGTVAAIKEWKSFIQGALWAFTGFLTLVVIPILAWALYAIVTLDSHIQTSINTSLNAYNIHTPNNE